MREFLRQLNLDSNVINAIMKEHGKVVTKNKEELQALKSQMKGLIETSEYAHELQDKYDKLLKETEERDAKQKAADEERTITDSISSLFEGKTFTSEYARKGLINDIKEGLNNPDNEGKTAQDLFNELTKDRTDIFTSPNQLRDMEGMGDSESQSNVKEIPVIW